MSTSEIERPVERIRVISQDDRGIVLINDLNDESSENAPLSLKDIEQKDHYNLAFQEGWDACRKKGEEKDLELNREIENLRQEIQTLNTSITVASEDIPNALNTYLEALEALIIKNTCNLSFAIANVIVHRELEQDPDTLRVVNDSLSKITKFKDVKVFLNHDDYEHLGKIENHGLSPEVSIVSDPSLQRGDGKIECEQELIDASIKTRLDSLSAIVHEKLNSSKTDELRNP